MNSDLNPIVTRKSTAAEKNSFQWSQNSLFLNPQNSLDLFPHPRPIPPEFCINYCFQMLLGGLYIPKSINLKQQFIYAKCGGQTECIMGDSLIVNRISTTELKVTQYVSAKISNQ